MLLADSNLQAVRTCRSFSLCCSLSLGLINVCAEGRLGRYSWVSSEVLITSLLLVGFMQVLNNLGERLAGGNLVVEGWFFRAVLWISAQELSCLANHFFLCVLALRSGSALWETAALCSSFFLFFGWVFIPLGLVFKMILPQDLPGIVSAWNQFLFLDNFR